MCINPDSDLGVGILAVYINGGVVGINSILGTVNLDLVSAVHLNLIHNSGNNSVIVGHSVNAKYLILILVQNLNLLILQSRVILGNLGEVVQELLARALILILVSVDVQGIGVLVIVLGYFLEDTNGLGQAHVLLADGLVVLAIVVLVGISVITPYNSSCVDCIVDQLCSVLTRASCGEGSVYILQQAVLVSQCVGLGCPVRAYQTSLLSVVTQGYQQHLSSFLSGYLAVRIELGVALTGNDAQGLAVLNIASSPVAVDVGERGLVIVVRRSVRLTGTQNIDHLCHLRTSYSAVRLERTVFETVNDTQRNQHIHSVSSLNVGLIRECCTSEHGECTSKRQHQCENLFEMACENRKINTKHCF